MSILSLVCKDNAERLSPLGLEPGRLWSLGNMLRFYAEKFLVADRYVTQLSIASNIADIKSFDPEARQEFIQKLEWLTATLEELELGISAQLAQELVLQLKKEDTVPSDTVGSTGRLFDIMRRELAVVHFLALSPSEKVLYEPKISHFGNQVRERFPSAIYEIDEAAKCLALGRTTASAFHSIRCLEAAIRAISRCLDIPDPTKGNERSWANALRAVKTEVDKKWPASGRLEGDGRLFEDLYATLSALQNPWRNSTMHLDQKYTAEESRHIFDSVGVLMKKVACRCDELGEPKA